MGIGDWGLGIGPNPQSPIPNPQNVKLLTIKIFNHIKFILLYFYLKHYIY